MGKVGQVYLDDRTGQPEWVSVNTGFFGTSESLVPLSTASAESGTVRLAYDKQMIKDAPRVDADDHLDPQEEERLWAHYGLDYAAGTSGTGTYAGTESYAGTDTRASSGTGDAMTLSEEHLDVHTERREAGHARLRKYVVTDTETVTVPVTREEVRLEREPITEGNRGDAYSGADLTESEHEVTLTEERPVVTKETVPTERVRLAKDTVTEERAVSEEVRHEEVDLDATDDRRL